MSELKWYRLTNPSKPKSEGLQNLVDFDRFESTNPVKRFLGNAQAVIDRVTDVSDSQKMQRLGLNKVKVEKPIPYVRGWNDDFEDRVIDPLVKRLETDVRPYFKKMFEYVGNKLQLQTA